MTHSDCIAYLRTLPDASVDSCVTDPPYELGFMGKKWDSSGIAYSVELWREVLRALKPGAHLLAFGGTRTHHRMVCAIEDAGFEIRDEMQWLYGSGFPKSLDVSKMIDQQERNKWLNVSKAIDNIDQSTIMEAWKERSKTAINAGLSFRSELPGVGLPTPSCDSVPVSVLLQANPKSSDAIAIVAELSSSEAPLTSKGLALSVLSSAGENEKRDRAKSAESLPRSDQAKSSDIGIVQCDVREWPSESTAATLRAGEALMTWLGKTKSSSKADTDALCAALTDDLRHITLSQSKTFQSFDTTQQTAFVSAITATITESTAASLISFTVATLRSKAIDKAAGAEREVVGENPNNRPNCAGKQTRSMAAPITVQPITAPATDAAKQWQGWGTALKPACEPICVARKPLCGTVAANVLAHGTGAINVDGSRIDSGGTHGSASSAGLGSGKPASGVPFVGGVISAPHPQGRWPANVILSHAEGCVCTGTKRVKGSDAGVTRTTAEGWGMAKERRNVKHADADGLETVEAWQCVEGCPVRLLDAQSGTLTSPAPYVRGSSVGAKGIYGKGMGDKAQGVDQDGYSDTGGASRFFYTAKASRSEREHFNTHATVKPLALMRYLVRLVTPPGGVVLDMFAGSGTTLVAARQEGFRFLGCDADEGHVRIAQDRLALELPFET